MTGEVPELSRPFAVAKVGAGTQVVVEAQPEECVALAARMGVPAIHGLTCRFELRRDGAEMVAAAGLLRARLSQVCVVSLEAFESELVERFAIRFVPAGQESEALDIEADDEIVYEGEVIDLGEAASEQLALALDPFPRRPGAEMPVESATPDASPFASLGRLLRPN